MFEAQLADFERNQSHKNLLPALQLPTSPNNRMQATASSVRSYVAPASGSA
jgi:hypothetical protein